MSVGLQKKKFKPKNSRLFSCREGNYINRLVHAATYPTHSNLLNLLSNFKKAFTFYFKFSAICKLQHQPDVFLLFSSLYIKNFQPFHSGEEGRAAELYYVPPSMNDGDNQTTGKPVVWLPLSFIDGGSCREGC
ncbi:hypothetical protein ISCGN_025102 [Ixodes scapularis]